MDTLHTLWQQADDTYMRLLKLARLALRDHRGDLSALRLNGDRDRTLAGWIVQAGQFYTNALASPELLARLVTHGVTEAKLRAGQVQLLAVEHAQAVQQRNRGRAKQHKGARDAALQSLNRWYADFIQTARIALEHQPQQLEKLGKGKQN